VAAGPSAAPTMLSASSRPRLAPKARLRFDRKTERYMLLYPEKGMVLNPTAADVLQLCTGEHTVASIVERLAARYGQDARQVEREVLQFLGTMADRGLVQETS
jgi:pyrroloquinoline quinone biosynthesis protein D